ncbi:unnamed protein product, partial [Anisakis simplex]|uniref:VWFA domain-containing protein n=1 Tax=Anisakis simplex TaxID=6269 RepID=A0A0M3J4C7_ANISI
MWLLLTLFHANAIFARDWPTSDVLFVVDSTSNVGAFNFELVKKFMRSVVANMHISSTGTRVGLAEYTPKANFLFTLISGINKDELDRRINTISYSPCEQNCYPLATINSLAKAGLSIASGNRPLVPDVMIIISSSSYELPELGIRETLMKPISPIFVFSINVGALDAVTSSTDSYASSATTIRFS